LADKAYASKVNRDALRGCHRDGIMRKTARHQPLRAWEQREGQAELCAMLCHDEAPPDSPGWPQQEVQLAMAATGQNLR